MTGVGTCVEDCSAKQVVLVLRTLYVSSALHQDVQSTHFHGMSHASKHDWLPLAGTSYVHRSQLFTHGLDMALDGNASRNLTQIYSSRVPAYTLCPSCSYSASVLTCMETACEQSAHVLHRQRSPQAPPSCLLGLVRRQCRWQQSAWGRLAGHPVPAACQPARYHPCQHHAL